MEALPYIDTFGEGTLVFGGEEVVTDFATMTSPLTLPPSFTICSSLLLTSLPTLASFFSLVSSTGAPWVALALRPPHPGTSTYRVDLALGASITQYPTTTRVAPTTWLHACLSLHTAMGQVEVVVSGKVVAREEMEVVQPVGVRLVVGKLGRVGYWQQARTRVTAINIHADKLESPGLEELTTGGRCGGAGDLLAWRDMVWRVEGAAVVRSTTMAEVCRPPPSLLVLTATFPSWTSCMAACPKLGARVVEVETPGGGQQLLEAVAEALPREEGEVGRGVWLAASDSLVEGEWRDHYTHHQVDLPWVAGRPVNDTSLNCAIGVPQFGGMVDFSCHMAEAPLLCPCSRPRTVTLRGLPTSSMDTALVAANSRDTGEVAYYGTTTAITWEGGVWRLEVLGQPTTAWSPAPHSSLLLGRHPWTIESSEDGQVKPRTTHLKLTACREGEFTCDDGQCVRMEERCDQVVHCSDGSDEVGCMTVVLQGPYNSLVPPVTMSPNNTMIPVTINISLVAERVTMDEVKERLGVEMDITLEWCESGRVEYHNLKAGANRLPRTEAAMLWRPRLKARSQVDRMGEVVVAITRQGTFSRSSAEVVDEMEVFQAEENKLVLEERLGVEFECTLNLKRYPFDRVECRMELELEGRVVGGRTGAMARLQQAGLVVIPTSLKTFTIMDQRVEDTKEGVVVMVVLGRNVTRPLVTTFLPTALLLLASLLLTTCPTTTPSSTLLGHILLLVIMTIIVIIEEQGEVTTSQLRMMDVWLVFCELAVFAGLILCLVTGDRNRVAPFTHPKDEAHDECGFSPPLPSNLPSPTLP